MWVSFMSVHLKCYCLAGVTNAQGLQSGMAECSLIAVIAFNGEENFIDS